MESKGRPLHITDNTKLSVGTLVQPMNDQGQAEGPMKVVTISAEQPHGEGQINYTQDVTTATNPPEAKPGDTPLRPGIMARILGKFNPFVK